MNLDNISYERLQQIEQEREETQSDPAFHSWVKQLNVGRMWVNKDGMSKASLMMEDWRGSKKSNSQKHCF